MDRTKQHGPIIEIDRIRAQRSRQTAQSVDRPDQSTSATLPKTEQGASADVLAGEGGCDSVFNQIAAKLPAILEEATALQLPGRVWKVKFQGESVDDCGGGYSDSIADMCSELESGATPVLMVTPNGRDQGGPNQDCFVLNPTLKETHKTLFHFLGVLVGIAIRSGAPLSIHLAEPMWKLIVGQPIDILDLNEVDSPFLSTIQSIMDLDSAVLIETDLPFACSTSVGRTVALRDPEQPRASRAKKITLENRVKYLSFATAYRLTEFNTQIAWVREGIARVVPLPVFSLFTGAEIENLVLNFISVI